MSKKTIAHLKSAMTAANAFIAERKLKPVCQINIALIQKAQIEQHVLQAVLQSLEGDHSDLLLYATLYEII